MTIEEAMNNNAQIEANEKELEPSKEEVFKEPIEQKASNENENIVENTSFIEPVEKKKLHRLLLMIISIQMTPLILMLTIIF
ncbi:MAG: hypothetical protein L6V95_11820 [Candidatus Melainabacteria bacterium]|nr:MAG: hypothetical protein L6V95_11820 [Candidatus Melainabacteria bacterium]